MWQLPTSVSIFAEFVAVTFESLADLIVRGD